MDGCYITIGPKLLVNQTHIKIFFCLMIVISVAGCADTIQIVEGDADHSSERNHGSDEDEEIDNRKYRVFPTKSELSHTSNTIEWGKDTPGVQPEFIASPDVPQWHIDRVAMGHEIAASEWGNYGPLQWWIVGNSENEAAGLEEYYCVIESKQRSMGDENREKIGFGYCMERDHNIVSYAKEGGAGLSTDRDKHLDESLFVVTMASKNPYPNHADYEITIFHEYFHVYQNAHVMTEDGDERRKILGNEAVWWMEGGAEYMGQLLYSRVYPEENDQEHEEWFTLEERMGWKIEAKNELILGERMEDIMYGERQNVGYDLGAWATALLIHKYSEEAYLSLYDDIEEIGFEEAFAKNFGVSLEEFLDEFHNEFLELSLEEQLKIIP
jgi:hypothetical protein